MEWNVREQRNRRAKVRGVFTTSRYNYLLQGVNVTPLLRLMHERGVTKLTSHDEMTAGGTFSNPKSRESKSGLEST